MWKVLPRHRLCEVSVAPQLRGKGARKPSLRMKRLLPRHPSHLKTLLPRDRPRTNLTPSPSERVSRLLPRRQRRTTSRKPNLMLQAVLSRNQLCRPVPNVYLISDRKSGPFFRSLASNQQAQPTVARASTRKARTVWKEEITLPMPSLCVGIFAPMD